jgi:hypothetical protein
LAFIRWVSGSVTLTSPEIYEMRVRAIFRAAKNAAERAPMGMFAKATSGGRRVDISIRRCMAHFVDQKALDARKRDVLQTLRHLGE